MTRAGGGGGRGLGFGVASDTPLGRGSSLHIPGNLLATASMNGRNPAPMTTIE